MGRYSTPKTFVRGAVIGVLVGAVIGVLVAPKSGKESRAALKRQAGKFSGDAEDRLFDLDKHLSQQIDSLKDVAKELRGDAYEESHRMITRAEIMKQDLQDSIRKFGKDGGASSEQLLGDAKRLVREGSKVVSQLEKMTREAINKRSKGGDGEV